MFDIIILCIFVCDKLIFGVWDGFDEVVVIFGIFFYGSWVKLLNKNFDNFVIVIWNNVYYFDFGIN